MANKQKARTARELRRRRHVRNKVSGTAERPRLTVCKTLRNTSAQLIDDQKGETLAFTTSGVLKSGGKSDKSKTDVAKEVGQKLASLALVSKKLGMLHRPSHHGRRLGRQKHFRIVKIPLLQGI